jgi:hypothetical protein
MTQYGVDVDSALFKADPCRFLENAIKEYVRTSPLNHLTAFEDAPMVEEPIVAFGDGDDPIFRNPKASSASFT